MHLKKNFKLIIYSLNLGLCLHLAINSLLLFNNFFGSGKSKMCIFSSKHRLHLLSKVFGVFSSNKIFYNELKNIKQTLLNNGFPNCLVDKQIKLMINNMNKINDKSYITQNN